MSSPCIGCGVILNDLDGPTHGYMESSPACWSTYSEVLAREYSDRALFERVHRLTVDSYAAQHPGRASAQSIQSVAGHLMSLCAVLEDGASSEWATKVIREAVRIKGRFTWLQPPRSMGSITVVNVWRAKGPAEHEKRVRDWASSVWAAWSQHHSTIRFWLSSVGGSITAPNYRIRRLRLSRLLLVQESRHPSPRIISTLASLHDRPFTEQRLRR